MTPIFDFEATYCDHYWSVEAPIESPIENHVFNYISSTVRTSIREVIEFAERHLDKMEKEFGVTFDIVIKRNGTSLKYNIRNEYDKLTMILKYS